MPSSRQMFGNVACAQIFARPHLYSIKSTEVNTARCDRGFSTIPAASGQVHSPVNFPQGSLPSFHTQKSPVRSASGDSHPDLGGWVHWSFKCLLIAGIQEEQR